ncbi:MAG: DegV family EDD domain-containing protein, partial [Oscillospiraceae bacterium]|nr:DegV family EDD domain-containing protein [Oscillospiraceae bacterium]
MSDYVLSCCSTVDLTAEHLASRNLSHICFHFQLDGTSYPDDLGKSVPFETFYRKMTEGAETSTSQINIAEYLDYFEGFLKEGKDVLHITFSSGLSGSYLSARSAADIARERYPERKLFVVDSLAASSGYGLLMDKVADLRDEGLGIEELAKWVEENRLRLHHWFFSTDLTFYIKGGRVSKTSGAIAGVLGICPLLNMDEEGRLTPRMKIRSKKKVKEKIVEQMQLLADDRTDYSGKCYICHSACLDDAKDVAEAVESSFPKLNGKVEIN